MKQKVLFLILLISSLSTFGSLYYSEIVKFAPCNLCWYQRVFMYPIFIISLIAFIKKEYFIFKYIIFLAIPGLLIAFYHVLLERGFVKESGVCLAGVSCADIYVEYFGFVTIPLLSLLSFVAIVFLVATQKLWSRESIKAQMSKS